MTDTVLFLRFFMIECVVEWKERFFALFPDDSCGSGHTSAPAYSPGTAAARFRMRTRL